MRSYRDRGLSIRNKLIALVVVPLLAATYYGGLVVDDRHDRSHELVDEQERLDLIRDLSELRTVVLLEGTAALAAIGVDELGVEGGADGYLDSLAGFRDRNRALTASLEGRADQITRLVSPGAWPSAAAGLSGISDVSVSVDRLLGLVEPDEIVVAIDEFDVASERIEALIVQIASTGSSRLRSSTQTLRDIADAEQAAGREAMLVFEEIVRTRVLGDDFELSVVVAATEAAAVVDQAMAGLDIALPPALAAAVAEFRLGQTMSRWQELRRRIESDAFGGTSTVVASDLFVGTSLSEARNAFLSGLRVAFGDEAAALIASDRATIEREFQTIWIVAAFVIVVIALAIAFVGRRLIGNLELLDVRARSISAGKLDVEPLNLRGRDETVTLGRTFDQMVATLRGVRAQAAALSSGNTDDPSFDEELPGPVGADLARSVEQMRILNERLRASEALSRSVVETAAEAILTIRPDGEVATINEAAETLLGVDASQTLTVEDIAPQFPVLRRLSVDVTNLEATVSVGSHLVATVLVSSRCVGSGDDQLRTVFIRDVTDSRMLERELAHQATHDDLTGLANRSALIVELDRVAARAVRRGSGYGVLFIDLDRFKAVNQTLGPQIGDTVLRQAADRIVAATRVTDFVARNGSDEFVIVAEEALSPHELLQFANRVSASVARPIQIEGDVVKITASIGAAWFEDNSEDALACLRHADAAMGHAKASGVGRTVLFDADLRTRRDERTQLERELRRAVDQRGLHAAIQPVVDLRTGEAVGAELLCRWTPAVGPRISPAEFIPIAEESSLVVDIGRFMLDQAGSVLASWADRPETRLLSLSVNLSSRHIMTPDVVADVRRAIERWEFEPSRLVLEMTETALLGDIRAVADTLARLRSLGVRVAVDDFGVGYASLAYLRRLPVDIVKIDQSIVAGFDSDGVDAVIVQMVTQLGDLLDVVVVAEGIETDIQLELLKELGCTRGQGFLFSEPMGIELFRSWHDRWLIDARRHPTHIDLTFPLD